MKNSLLKKTIIAVLLSCSMVALTSCNWFLDNNEYEQSSINTVEPIIITPGGTEEAEEASIAETVEEVQAPQFRFRNRDRLVDHYEKHGKEMGYASAEDYEMAASAVVLNPNALSKLEAEDGDYIFYLEETNEIVFISKDGFIRTFFKPDSGKKYYDKQ